MYYTDLSLEADCRLNNYIEYTTFFCCNLLLSSCQSVQWRTFPCTFGLFVSAWRTSGNNSADYSRRSWQISIEIVGSPTPENCTIYVTKRSDLKTPLDY